MMNLCCVRGSTCFGMNVSCWIDHNRTITLTGLEFILVRSRTPTPALQFKRSLKNFQRAPKLLSFEIVGPVETHGPFHGISLFRADNFEIGSLTCFGDYQFLIPGFMKRCLNTGRHFPGRTHPKLAVPESSVLSMRL